MSANTSNSNKAIEIFKKILPSPFTIAILLSFFTLLLAMIITKPDDTTTGKYFVYLVSSWEAGLWDSSGGGLYFAFQMMLILVLGHILALTPFVNKIIQALINYCKDTKSSVVIVSFTAIIVGLINWGMGLIFGAIIARKIGEKFAKEQKKINYGLVGAAAYVTMMVWHGGLSGSATTKSMEIGSIQEMMQNVGSVEAFPESIPFEATIGSNMNIIVILLCLLCIPLFLFFLANKTKNAEKIPAFKEKLQYKEENKKFIKKGAERLDYSAFFGITLGVFILFIGLYQAYTYQGASSLGFINLNFINLMFLGLGICLHKSIFNFSVALQEAIGDVSGILIQFPFYFGILAIMKNSGLIIVFSDAITAVATEKTLPIFTFLSAGLVNFFVPSGGGQWAVQGPIILETTSELGGDYAKSILAMAYGDQLTNMIQPFWALPLLGITELKPQELLPYTFLLFLVGLFIFGLALLI
ncbi:MAG TPA: TIGR00366 family protein [Chitinophagaceae bacterium]|nr:TIGR00366 family protein [Chitinophagaceae bacterium]